MAGLFYVGADAAEAEDVSSRLTAEEVFNTGVSRSFVGSRIDALVAAKAAKAYVDTQDSTYASASYPTTQDALLVPNAAKGAASGVASLDGTSKIPTAQIPVLGAGILRGPYGPSTTAIGTTTSTPLKVAQWNLGPTGTTGQLVAWMNFVLLSNGGRPVLEIRVGDSTQTTYAAQTLIAQGMGRARYKDYQLLTALPVTAIAGEGQDGIQDAWASSTNLLVNAWVYDSLDKDITVSTGALVTAAVFVARTTL